MKKFDYCCGNPPYQSLNKKNGRQEPVYNIFMNEAYKVANCVELITPARFLFNAGQTPKEWNKKMLSDEHFKVISYESDASSVFSNTEIKGGVAITIRDINKEYGCIGTFLEFDALKEIIEKVSPKQKENLSDICVGAVPYSYSNVFKKEHPELVELMGDSCDLRTNAFEKLYKKAFFEDKHDDDATIVGIYEKKRRYFHIKEKYLNTPKNYNFYKVILSKAQGSDKFGEALSEIIIGEKRVGHTQSFISMGCLETFEEANNLRSYLKTKLVRCMLSILKKTQDITPYKWIYVPLQDFTSSSDIDWSKSISEIDQQLYKKYGLSEEEINFIETNVKEMV